MKKKKVIGIIVGVVTAIVGYVLYVLGYFKTLKSTLDCDDEF